MRPFLTVLAASSIVTLCCPALARAQSAVDGFNPGANGGVFAFAVQPDGKILVGGGFTTLGGGGKGTTTRNYIARLNSDGSVDAGFDPGANFVVLGLAVQPDGKILVGGGFGGLGGGTGTTPRNNIGRLNADGSLDTSFNPGTSAPTANTVYSIAVQPDQKIIVGGQFTGLGGGTGTTPRNNIGRLNADGSLDASFNPGANDRVTALTLQPDGKILVGGYFTGLGGGTGTTPRNHIGRLNADGSLDTSFNPGTSVSSNNAVRSIAVQPDQKIIVGGHFTGLGGGTGTTPRNHIGRLNADGSIDTSFNPGTPPDEFGIAALTVQADGKILVGGYFSGLGGGTGSTPRNRLGRLNPDGSVDAGFDPGTSSFSSKDVLGLAVQPDGKILVGGFFTGLGGGTGTTTRNSIGRLYADGSLDADLNPVADSSVYAVAVQPDGKILLGGEFTALSNQNDLFHQHLGRLSAGGAFDATFELGTDGPVNALAVQSDGKVVAGGSLTTFHDFVNQGSDSFSNIGRFNPDGGMDYPFKPNSDGPVNALAVQPDGKILVGGSFETVGGQEAYNIGRLNPDGSIDGTFALWTNGAVHAIAMQPDGKILVGGAFTTIYDDNAGIQLTRNRIGRLNADGSLDYAFDPGADGPVNTVAVQRDGKILVGGAFSTLGGQEEGNLGRLNADGSVDTSFALWTNEQVWALALHTDGKILLGGAFTTIYDDNTGVLLTRQRIARLNAEGSVDTSFDPGANNYVYALAVQEDGKVVVGGVFSMLGGGATTPRSHIGRLTNGGAAIQRLRVTTGGSVVSWSRSGAAPEVWRVTFESSNDGVTYTSLGAATRVANGWRLSGQSLPTNQNLYIRARGYFASGLRNGSGSIVESIVRTVVKTSVPFTDNVLTAGATTMRAVHITELRARIDALRIRFGLAAYAYPAAPLTPGTTVVQAPHINDLRTALSQAYVAAGEPMAAFTEPTLAVQSTVIKAVHLNELRDAVFAIEP